jgi:hypothetical protein
MPQQAMAKRPRVSRRVDAQAIVIVEGRIVADPELTVLPGERGEVCLSELQSGELDLIVIGRGANASVLAAMDAERDVRVVGRLVRQSWHTGETDHTKGKEHSRWAIEVDSVRAGSHQAEDVA